jgi:hypothetical protein
MANHCYNYGYFSGDSDQIKKLEEALEREKVNHLKEDYTDKGLKIPSFLNGNSVILYSKNYNLILSDKKDDFTQPGYDVYNLYGSKWFECEWEVYADREIQLMGSSAWSPVIPFFQKICKTYQLESYGDYSESGNDFAGEFTINKEGELFVKEMTYLEYEAINNPESFWDYALELVEMGNFIFFEDVLDYFKEVNWELSKSEIETLTRYYKNHLQELANKKGK